jgi:hypothetical protein
VKGHAEIVGKVFAPVAAVALAEVAGIRIAIPVQYAIQKGISQRRVDGIVLGLMAHDHLQQRGHSLVEFALVVDASVVYV